MKATTSVATTSVATTSDAAIILKIVRASITQLCVLDHSNDKAKLDEWLNNKTLENILKWIEDEKLYFIKAELNGQIVAMGCANLQGRILMNYVSPKHQYLGASKAIMQDLERFLLTSGITKATLESSKTALKFYQACNWQIKNGEDDTIQMFKIL